MFCYAAIIDAHGRIRARVERDVLDDSDLFALWKAASEQFEEANPGETLLTDLDGTDYFFFMRWGRV